MEPRDRIDELALGPRARLASRASPGAGVAYTSRHKIDYRAFKMTSARLIPRAMTALPGDLVGFTLVNDGPGRISFGFNTRFERYDHGHWIGCYVENAAVSGILI